MNLDNPVNQLIVEKGLTQTELAEELGVDRAHLNKVINCTRESGPLRFRIARYFGRPEKKLFIKNQAGRKP